MAGGQSQSSRSEARRLVRASPRQAFKLSIRRLVPVPKNPPGWNVTEVSITPRLRPYVEGFRSKEPAGDPPPDWPGTRPEWAVFWGLMQLGYEEGVDFFYLSYTMALGKGDFSQLDFFLPAYRIGIEIQGEFWHYRVGSEAVARDHIRRAQLVGYGIRLIFIDEEDALVDPVYFVREAIAGRDHSKTGRTM